MVSFNDRARSVDLSEVAILVSDSLAWSGEDNGRCSPS